MNRLAINKLVTWKNSTRRKPLLVEGARQVGKTWLVKEFAKQYYENLIYINFEESIHLRELFKTDYDVKRVLVTISAATGEICVPGKTLIFFDEVQEAEGAITALKYFCENAPEQHVIAAGSLLGVNLHKRLSFPVGKVQFLTLYPMNFIEFLEAVGESGLANLIKEQNWEPINTLSSKYRELLKQYYLIGGMPEVVKEFSSSGNWQECREIQKEILLSYERDFSKHAPLSEVPRIGQVWRSLPEQLSKDNRKFIYGVVREGARARQYEDALQWLIDAGLLIKVPNVTAPRIPLASYESRSIFKIFLLDVGLMGAMCDLTLSTISNGNAIYTEFKGAMTEQYVAQQLVEYFKPYYWAKANSSLEIDFLIQQENDILPLEVKAETNLNAKSLKQYIADYSPIRAYRISMADYRREEKLINLPLYAVDALGNDVDMQ